MDIKQTKIFAAKIRLETVKMIGKRGFGHVAGSLSVADALAVLYNDVMQVRPENPTWDGRDKLVMSKGHAGPALYSALALKGFFPMDWLNTLNQPNTKLPSHCDAKLTPGVDATTGSLGQGASVAVGIALARQMDGLDARTYLFLGDGECNEGQVWEAAMFANQHKLANLTAFVDYNKRQLDGTVAEVMDLGDIAAKFASFGWYVQVVDGSCVEEIHKALTTTGGTDNTDGKPLCIILDTVKGAGVSVIENVEMNHHMVVEGDLLNAAIAECEAILAELGA
ncbi:MAG: transketolase [Defluviitaleaceae bacterium]|nr:transketolase [Defluviitaleaceae bacterium]